MKKLSVLVSTIIFVMALVSCSDKKEEQVIPRAPVAPAAEQPEKISPAAQAPQLPAGHPSVEKTQEPDGAPHGMGMPKVEKKVTVPDAVKKSWSRVKFVFTDKASGKQREVIADIGKEVAIEGTNLKIKVGEFLPEFQMSGEGITSKSNEPNQPAVRVEVMEQGKTIHKGWLFAKMPDVHPFEHPKYGLVLKEGLK
ncbi:MAG TPA: DUF2155 domain-containing protein [Dissulfurispiraceae bacterium]|nr:DUF2155 domain-containing protein [Dissulfurispiraceae bacterium]